MKTAHWIRQTYWFRPDEYICFEYGTSCDKPYSVCPACDAPMRNTKHDPSWVDEAAYLSAIPDDDW